MRAAFFSSRRLFLGVIGTVLVLTGLGWGLWSLSAVQYRRVIDGYIDSGRAAGYVITYDQREVFGFPRRVTMRLVNVHWRDADGVDFRTDDMDITVTPWRWSDFDAKFKTHVVVAAPLDDKGHSLLLSGGEGHAHVVLTHDGFWKVANLSLDDATAGLAPDYVFRSHRLSVDVSRPETPPKDHTAPGLLLHGHAQDLTIPPVMASPFGGTAESLTLNMRVMGAVPDVRERGAVGVWNKASGIVEFDEFSLHWGQLAIQSKGTLGFDDDLQPEGAFAGTVANPKQTMQTLMDKGYIAIHDADMLKAVMDMFAKPTKTADGLELPITVQLGGLFFGPVRIFTFPEIEWPLAPPPVTPVPPAAP